MLDNLYPPKPSRVLVDIAPTYNALASLVTVADASESPGIGDWPVRTSSSLSREEREKHRLIASWIGIEALSNAVDASGALESFPAFIRALAEQEPIHLRDALLHWIVASPGSRLAFTSTRRHVEDPLSLLESEQAFSSLYDLERKSEDEIRIMRRLFERMSDPASLQSLITGYLDRFWHEHLEREWERAVPDLESAVAGFRRTDTAGMSHFEVIEAITQRNLRGVYRADALASYATLRFIPSPHCGPYTLRMTDGKELRIVFGMRQLNALAHGGDNRHPAYMLDRFRALGDETRLAIVRLVKERGELGTQEIIEELRLSRSAASRHLRQLYANNIVDIRVDEDGIRKHYRLSEGLAQELQSAIASLLG
jgi:DNA-binding transcriptional ArsR family regulator